MFSTLAMAGVLALLGAAAQAEVQRCGVDEAEASRLMSLSWDDFDQDHTPGGWRQIAARPDCFGAAAEMIGLYLVASTHLPQPDSHEVSGLRWHAGQMRAMDGQVDAAIALFASTYDPPDVAAESSGDWNAYVDATIAFMRNDRAALESARERVAAGRLPAAAVEEREAALAAEPGQVLPPLQPQYLMVTDRLIACFGHPYVVAQPGRCETEGAK